MKCFVLIFALFISQRILSAESLIEVPDSCIEKKITPCLIRSEAHVSFTYASLHIQMPSKGSVLQVQKKPGTDKYNIHLIEGVVSIFSDAEYQISDYHVISSDLHYVRILKNKNVQILEAKTLDLKTFGQESTTVSDSSVKNGNIYVLQKTELLSRSDLVRYLSDFYESPASLRSELSKLSKKYKVRVQTESKAQSLILQKHMNRKMASVEDAEEKRKTEHLRILADRKRSRQLFFMRTFDQ
jgi:hypothetical protein